MAIFGKRLSLKRLKVTVGREMGLSDWFVVTQERIDAFAAATEDRQWIHVDPERAARSPLGGTVAHGFLLLSLVPFFNYSIDALGQAGHGRRSSDPDLSLAARV
ncbi:MAG: MaoC/PaaZ C-terminal domain-containing protein [Candidatus Aminicenantales bacterium]